MPFISNIFQALSKTREKVADAFDNIVKRKVTPDSLEQLEEVLLSSDMGFETVSTILNVVEKHHDEGFISKV